MMEEVEVACAICHGVGRIAWEAGDRASVDECYVCEGTGKHITPVVEGSLTAARLRLADAAEKWFKAARSRVRNGQPDRALDEAWMAFQRECEALHTTRGT